MANYGITFTDNSPCLKHHGVKGMKWGETKARKMEYTPGGNPDIYKMYMQEFKSSKKSKTKKKSSNKSSTSIKKTLVKKSNNTKPIKKDKEYTDNSGGSFEDYSNALLNEFDLKQKTKYQNENLTDQSTGSISPKALASNAVRNEIEDIINRLRGKMK